MARAPKNPGKVDFESIRKDAEKILSRGKKGESTPEDQLKIKRSFDKARKRILEELKDGDADMIAIQLMTLRALLRTALGLMAISEETAHKFRNERAMYATVAIATMVRDLLSDIGRLSDRDLLANKLGNDVLDPSLMLLGQHFAQGIKSLQADLSGRVDKKTEKWLKLRLDDLAKDYLPLIKEIRVDIRDKMTRILETKR